jgi:hypothetical protein
MDSLAVYCCGQMGKCTRGTYFTVNAIWLSDRSEFLKQDNVRLITGRKAEIPKISGINALRRLQHSPF